MFVRERERETFPLIVSIHLVSSSTCLVKARVGNVEETSKSKLSNHLIRAE